jgi:uncharacterized protein YraI
MLLSTVVQLLLPIAALAAPAPATEITPNKMAIREAAGAGLAAANILCQIVSRDGPVNCRSGPGTSYGIVTKVYKGDYWDFTCYSDGTEIDHN